MKFFFKVGSARQNDNLFVCIKVFVMETLHFFFLNDPLFHPVTTLPKLFALLSDFRAISGLRENQLKSEALNINLPDLVLGSLQTSFSFKWSTQVLRYPGVKLT